MSSGASVGGNLGAFWSEGQRLVGDFVAVVVVVVVVVYWIDMRVGKRGDWSVLNLEKARQLEWNRASCYL